MSDWFHRFAHRTAEVSGSPWAFALAVTTIAVWGVTGPLFAFSDTWQLVINTGTTIVTFLMVFLIQNTQNRDAKALQLKLDELLRAVPAARTALVDLEELSETELDALQQEFRLLRRLVRKKGWESGPPELSGRRMVQETGPAVEVVPEVSAVSVEDREAVDP